MSHVLPTLCLLSRKILRMVEKMHELEEKILDKDDVIHHWWTRALWAERRVGVLTAEIAGKDVEIAALNAELAAVRVRIYPAAATLFFLTDR
ncbi:hypothetical protein BOTNAR_0129g00240 [Botryotinia narcissicola]|uniref:Uncharacterized protein n=1 Tax=Botryotinia narcissicola TaxID=278944 RepID=A0A4Z1IX64_9HELO|nr:hypothetical protein BOTNAR_0129g00240 [Botryotinia narcissicola]